MAKLTAVAVKAIKRDLQDGLKQQDIANKHGVSRSVVSDIATGRRHRTDDHDPTNARILELESENLALREERNRFKAKSRVSARELGVFKAMAEELSVIKPLTALAPKIKATGDAIEEHAVMHLSDGHHDQTVTPEECGGLEDYNFQISCARAENYVGTVLDWVGHTLRGKFRFSHLWVLAYGDHTSGEIHGAVDRSYYRNQFKNCLAIGGLHSLMLRDLASVFDNVHVVYLAGNHGRRSPKKDFHGAHNNWDYLVARTAEQYCRDLPNVDFLIPDSFSVNLDINGHGFNISHGDDVRGNNGIPWYGLTRRQKSLIALNSAYGTLPLRYFVCGHHHNFSSLSDVNGELLMNGAWVGTDSYAYNTFAGYREPVQLFHGVHKKYGVSWRLPVKLRTKGERHGPQRYRINGDEVIPAKAAA